MIYACGDDMPLLSQWIKNSLAIAREFLVGTIGLDGLCPSFASQTPDYVRLRREGSSHITQNHKRKKNLHLVSSFWWEQ